MNTMAIIMLTYAVKTPEYEERFDFSEHSIGTSFAILTTSTSNTAFAANDYSPFNGMRVGFIRGANRKAAFDDYAKEKGFSYTPVYYEDIADMQTALAAGAEIDAMCQDSLTPSNFFTFIRKRSMKSDSAHWDIYLGGFGGSFLIGGWFKYLNYTDDGTGYCVGGYKDETLQKLFSTAYTMEGHTEENMTALLDYAISDDNAYIDALCIACSNVVYSKAFSSLYYVNGSWFYPGS